MNIFLNAPADLDALWKALAKPDFVILRGEEYTRLRDALRSAPSRTGPWVSVVDSVSVEGSVRDDQASLTVDLGVTLAGDGPVWVPVRLDGLTLDGAREGGRDLPVRTGEGGARQVEVSGKGRHTIQVKALAVVLLTPEGKRLDLAIPEAPATRFSLEVPARVAAAHAGVADPVTLTPVRDRGATRLSADLPPRPRLALVWRVDEESGAPLPPLLVAQGEIAVDVEPGSFRTRSSWSIRSVRGTARSLQIRFDKADELLELDLDGQTPPAGTDEENGAPRMTIPLTEPLGPGQERKLVMTTRRPIPASGTARVSFSGFPLTSAREQTGAIGVTQGGGLWITGTPIRGLRQIDPRTELPAELRARPGTALAYQFSGQPFALELQIEPSPPQVRPEGRTTVMVEPGLARVDSWFDYLTARGRLYELTLSVPPGLEIESVGPEEVVGSWQISGLTPGAGPAADLGGLRLLTVRLLPKVQEGGRFGLHVVGRQGLESAREARVGLLRPLGVVSGGGRIAVLTDPSLTADVSEPGDGAPGGGVFRAAAQAPPADWPWPSGKAPGGPPMLWLRYLQSPGELPLRIAAHPRSVTHATSLQLRVSRREVEVQQEIECSIRYGSVDHLDVEVPAALDRRWEVDGGAVVSRSDLGPNARGVRTYRLAFASDVSRGTRLRFRYRLPFGSAPEPGHPVEVKVPWIRPVGSVATPGTLRATVTAEPGLGLSLPSEVWQPSADVTAAPAAGGDGEGSAERLSRSAPEADVSSLDLRVTARAIVALPTLVVPRMALRTVQTSEGDLRTTAWLGVETQGNALSFALPASAALQRVRVGGVAVEQIEQLPGGAGFRAALPTRPAPGGRVLVELDYIVRAAQARGAWVPVRLVEGGLVQETSWEVSIPWTRALVGVPSGWSDENHWYWDTYVWKRRPNRRTSEVAAWVTGASGRAAADPSDDGRGDYHSYLFERPGPPVDMPATVVSRALLVGAGSGITLGLAIVLTLFWHPSLRRLAMAGLALVLLAVLTLHPSTVFLSLQSAAVGIVLSALFAVMRRFVERRRQAAATFVTAAVSGSALGAGSSVARADLVGSDDSTAIRTRPVQSSTLDYVAAPPPPQAPPPSAPDAPPTTAGDETEGTGVEPGAGRGSKSGRSSVRGVSP